MEHLHYARHRNGRSQSLRPWETVKSRITGAGHTESTRSNEVSLPKTHRSLFCIFPTSAASRQLPQRSTSAKIGIAEPLDAVPRAVRQSQQQAVVRHVTKKRSDRPMRKSRP